MSDQQLGPSTAPRGASPGRTPFCHIERLDAGRASNDAFRCAWFYSAVRMVGPSLLPRLRASEHKYQHDEHHDEDHSHEREQNRVRQVIPDGRIRVAETAPSS